MLAMKREALGFGDPGPALERDRRRWNHRRRESREKTNSWSVIAEGGITEGVNHAGKQMAGA
jgi:hypothetical protein